MKYIGYVYRILLLSIQHVLHNENYKETTHFLGDRLPAYKPRCPLSIGSSFSPNNRFSGSRRRLCYRI
jgi:hypothetical protein